MAGGSVRRPATTRARSGDRPQQDQLLFFSGHGGGLLDRDETVPGLQRDADGRLAGHGDEGLRHAVAGGHVETAAVVNTATNGTGSVSPTTRSAFLDRAAAFQQGLGVAGNHRRAVLVALQLQDRQAPSSQAAAVSGLASVATPWVLRSGRAAACFSAHSAGPKMMR